VISTHSDYVVRELSNLVRLGARGEAGASLAQALGYDPKGLLRADEVGVWMLREGTAERVKVDEEGFTITTIDDAIEDQNRVTQAIFFGGPE
jgi:hypothetical protein